MIATRIGSLAKVGWLKPAGFIAAIGLIFGAVFYFLISDRPLHESFQMAKILSETVGKSEQGARVLYLVELPNGQTHVVSAGDGGAVAADATQICVELRRGARTGELAARLTSPENCG